MYMNMHVHVAYKLADLSLKVFLSAVIYTVLVIIKLAKFNFINIVRTCGLTLLLVYETLWELYYCINCDQNMYL